MNTFNFGDLQNFDARAVNKQMGAIVDYWTETYIEGVQKFAETLKVATEKQVELTDTVLKAAKKTSK